MAKKDDNPLVKAFRWNENTRQGLMNWNSKTRNSILGYQDYNTPGGVLAKKWDDFWMVGEQGRPSGPARGGSSALVQSDLIPRTVEDTQALMERAVPLTEPVLNPNAREKPSVGNTFFPGGAPKVPQAPEQRAPETTRDWTETQPNGNRFIPGGVPVARPAIGEVEPEMGASEETAPEGTAPGGTTPRINQLPGAAAAFTRSTVALPEGREQVAYSDGQGNYMAGQRAAGAGRGGLSVMAGPGSRGMAPSDWDALSNEDKIARNVAAYTQAANTMQPQGGGGGGGRGPRVWGIKTPDWDTALADYHSGRVGTMGYNMVRNYLHDNPASGMVNGVKVVNRAGRDARERLYDMAEQAAALKAEQPQQALEALKARQEMQQAQQEAQRAREQSAYERMQNQREFALDRSRYLLDKNKYVDERNAAFKTDFSLANAGEEYPIRQLAQDALRLSEATGYDPYEVQAAMEAELAKQEGTKRAWDNPEKYQQFLANIMASLQ